MTVRDYVKTLSFEEQYLHKLYKTAKDENISNIFAQFLDEQDDNTRLWAAIFTLKTSPIIAEKTLQELAHSQTLTGLRAKTTLDLWEKGIIKFALVMEFTKNDK